MVHSWISGSQCFKRTCHYHLHQFRSSNVASHITDHSFQWHPCENFQLAGQSQPIEYHPNKENSHSVLFIQLLIIHLAIFTIMTEDYGTWTGVEKIKSSKFSHDRPGMIQHISAWFACSADICTMKYVMISMHGTPNNNDTRNAIRHFLISSLK
jgi:hypothetical protein